MLAIDKKSGAINGFGLPVYIDLTPSVLILYVKGISVYSQKNLTLGLPKYPGKSKGLIF